jgi:hypothetical protein
MHGTYHIIGNYAHQSGGCGCGGNSCIAEPIQTDSVIYSGPNLPCTGINTCNSLSVILEKLDAKICELSLALYNLTTSTTTTII